MIDWISCRVPFHHKNTISGGIFADIGEGGELQRTTVKYKPHKGSHDSTVNIRSHEDLRDSDGAYNLLEISGNITKFFQGHNCFGTNNFAGLVYEFLHSVADEYGIEFLTRDQENCLRGGLILTRLDMTEMFELPSNKDVDAWLYSAERCAKTRHGKGINTEGTLYFGKHSKRWSIKFYNKYKEISAKGHYLPDHLIETKLSDWTKTKLRAELVIRGKELQKIGYQLGAEWCDTTYTDIYNEYLGRLEMSDNYILSGDALAELPPRLVAVYHLWKEGHNIKSMYPKKTFYRYRKQLKEYGIDISVTQNDAKPSMANVVPLIRILEAVPASTPDWAEGTNLYFEPRKSC